MTRPVRLIGPYTEGEIPRPVTVHFDEEIIDLSGFTLTIEAEREGTPFAWAGDVAWAVEAEGICTLDFGADDVDIVAGVEPTSHKVQIKATDGTNTLKTVPILYDCYAAIGAVV